MSTAHIVRRLVMPDMSINYAGQRFCLLHLPDVHPGDSVTVLPGAAGCAPVIQAANAAQPDISASPSEPAHSCPRSGCHVAGTPASSDSPTTSHVPPHSSPCPAPHGHGTPQTPCCASPQAHSHSHSADTAGAAPGAGPIATLVALAQRLVQEIRSQGTGTWQQGGRVCVSLHFSGDVEPPLCPTQTLCSTCKTGFCLEARLPMQKGAFQ